MRFGQIKSLGEQVLKCLWFMNKLRPFQNTCKPHPMAKTHVQISWSKPMSHFLNQFGTFTQFRTFHWQKYRLLFRHLIANTFVVGFFFSYIQRSIELLVAVKMARKFICRQFVVVTSEWLNIDEILNRRIKKVYLSIDRKRAIQ